MQWPDLPAYAWVLVGICAIGGPAFMVLVASFGVVLTMLFERPIPWAEMRAFLADAAMGIPKIVILTWVSLIAAGMVAIGLAGLASLF